MNFRSVAPLVLSIAAGAGLALFAASRGAEAQPPPPKGGVIDTSSPFDHDIHMNPAKMNGKVMGCESCHKMANADGSCPKQEVRFPDHTACTECHSANFYVQPLTICTNCHKST